MNLTNIRPTLRPLCLLLLISPLFGSAIESLPQSDLKYQDRGDRHEGIDKGFPVSDKVELISATVNYNETLNQIPNEYKLKFYLSQKVPVFVRVREIDNRFNYWMDQLKPRNGWRQGFDNDFQWSTQDVIKRKQIKLDELGAVAQLGSGDSSLDMKVAPVLLFSSRLPNRIDGYSFIFKISRKADVTCSFTRDLDNSPVLSTQSFQVPGQRPRSVDWNVGRLSEGWYRLTITVIYSNNGQKVDQIIHFYHRPSVR
jgi:hypothetical protein